MIRISGVVSFYLKIVLRFEGSVPWLFTREIRLCGLERRGKKKKNVKLQSSVARPRDECHLFTVTISARESRNRASNCRLIILIDLCIWKWVTVQE